MFQPTSLSALGLVIQLNHRRGNCISPVSPFRDFTIYDVNGMHQVKISYCGCCSHDSSNTFIAQIFRQRWLPATWKQPRTAFTYALLRMFHIVNLQSKVNMYDWYKSLLRLSNNAGLDYQPVRQVHISQVDHRLLLNRTIITNLRLLFESGATFSSSNVPDEFTIQPVS
jgi:hypothetical protein